MKCFLSSAALVLAVASFATAETFNTPVSATASSAATDLWPAANLIQGPGVGFDANEPHAKLLGGADGNWVTDAPGGFPSDYVDVAGPVTLTFDMGSDVWMDEVSIWGYASTNANGVSEFFLNFATEAEPGVPFTGLGPFFPTNDETARQSFEFGAPLKARYVQMIATDNFFIAPGTGANGETPGGDRIGLGEVAFRQAVPEPAAGLLVLFGLMGLAFARRR